jgi:hypothetical protein
MPEIDINAADEHTYDVTVTADDGSRTEHTVHVSPAWSAGLGLSAAQEPALVRASMVYLLEREPPSSVLRSFGLDEIVRYFPEYPDEITELL